MAPRRVAIGALTLVVLAGCAGRSDRPRITTTSSAITTTTGTVAPTTSPPTTSTLDPNSVGAAGLGDPYFPTLGNGGYDVEHYSIALAVDPDIGTITEAEATITAVATMDLGAFNLDFSDLDIGSVSVDGLAAQWEWADDELTVRPTSMIPSGEDFSVTVAYRGTPEPVSVPSVGVSAGWIVTADGVFVAAEPDAAHTWFPANDHPADKATFTIVVTVPDGWVVASNGTLVGEATADSMTTFTWDMERPMATYLATIAIGEYRRIEFPGVDGVVRRDYVPVDLADDPPQSLVRTGEMIELFSEWFGPYPFTEYGHVVVSGFPGALETQTMTVIDRSALDAQIVAHELAHMWFGDDVSVADWSEIWLNEGFATFAELLWIEHDRGRDAMEATAAAMYETMVGYVHRPITDPTVAELFAAPVYLQAGLALHALRGEVGDDVMRTILHTYAARFAGGNVTTEDFLAVATEVAGIDVTEFLEPWLSSVEIPELP